MDVLSLHADLLVMIFPSIEHLLMLTSPPCRRLFCPIRASLGRITAPYSPPSVLALEVGRCPTSHLGKPTCKCPPSPSNHTIPHMTSRAIPFSVQASPNLPSGSLLHTICSVSKAQPTVLYPRYTECVKLHATFMHATAISSDSTKRSAHSGR